MSFGDFARNYLNPIYLAFRAGLLYGAGALLLVAFVSDAEGVFALFASVLGIWLAWTGIRPWGSGRGISANDL